MSNRFKPKFNIKKGDMVIVISGNSKPRKEDGKTVYKPRKVLKVLPEDARVVVEGVGMVTRHTKPSAKNTKGGLVKKEAPIHISNVMLWDAKAGVPTKVKRTRNEDGKLVRTAKKSGEVIK